MCREVTQKMIEDMLNTLFTRRHTVPVEYMSPEKYQKEIEKFEKSRQRVLEHILKYNDNEVMK